MLIVKSKMQLLLIIIKTNCVQLATTKERDKKMRYKDKDGYSYNHKCGYVNSSNTCNYCEPSYEIPMTSVLRKVLIALDNRGEIYNKPYINLNREGLSYNEFEKIKDITNIKTKESNSYE